MEGLRFGLPTRGAEWRFIAIEEVKRLLVFHLALEPKSFLQFLVLIVKPHVLLYKRNNV